MGFTREYVETLERLTDGLANMVGPDEEEWDTDEHIDTPVVQQVDGLDELNLKDFEESGTLVILPPEAFAPTDDRRRGMAMLSYAERTGHNVLFVYKGKVRRVRVYAINIAKATVRFSTMVEGYDVHANDGRGGYRTFRFDRISQLALVDPESGS